MGWAELYAGLAECGNCRIGPVRLAVARVAGNPMQDSGRETADFAKFTPFEKGP
jgi:hypothetical protein